MKKKEKRKLRKAMALPFDEGMPILRRAMVKDFELAFRPDIAEWCTRHSKEILETFRKERETK